MPIPRNRITQVRNAAGSGVRTPWATRTGGRSTADQVFARARIETARITENYFYQQEISRNPSISTSAPPTGRIALSLPYDGNKYFTRQACADASRGVRGDGGDVPINALVGHLMLADHAKTDLDEVLKLHESYNSVPIQVPISGPGGPGTLDQLSADKHTCEIDYDYAPEPLDVVALDVHVTLVDPDTVRLYEEDEDSRVSDKITQQANFESCLWLNMRVRLIVADRPGLTMIKPKIKRVSLGWPTITSMRALHLDVVHDGRALEKPPAISYNPLSRSIEWEDIAMSSDDAPEEDDNVTHHKNVLSFRSDTMVLKINQPGELYKQQRLDGEVEVEIPDNLLSGTQMRLFNGVGALETDVDFEVTTHVSTKLDLILDDEFARRVLTPYQHLYFDEVIPERGRITDIETALKDRGFSVTAREPVERDGVLKQLLLAQRSEGPEDMLLWLLAEGRRYSTEREDQVVGGQIYRSTFESGELKVFMSGALPRASRALTHEMNALQRALRERFDRLRARR